MCGMLAKDFHKLMKNIASFSNNQANVAQFEETLDEFKVEITPNDGLYSGGKFEFEIRVKDYPQKAPTVICGTQIYHPNIDENGEICLNLFSEWAETNTLEDCIQGLLFLLYNPNLEDPLSPWFDPEFDTDLEVFAENVRLSLEGGVVEGNQFERNLVVEDSVTGENSSNFQSEEREQTTNGDGVDNGEINEIHDQVVEGKITNGSEDRDKLNATTTVTDTMEITEDTVALNLSTKFEETLDFNSGKVNPHRTEDGITVTKENQ